MNSAFNNQDFIKRLTPDVGLLNKVRLERNWAYGIAAVLVLCLALCADKIRNDKKKYLLSIGDGKSIRDSSKA